MYYKEATCFHKEAAGTPACRLSILPPAPAFSSHQLWMSATLFQHLVSSLKWGVRTGCPSYFTGVGPNRGGFYAYFVRARRPNTSSWCLHVLHLIRLYLNREGENNITVLIILLLSHF